MQDLQVLMKVRLNVFVLITTFFGYYLGSRESGFDPVLLLNLLLGTAAAAFGSAAFNQLMEIEDDARMARTANRPLPSRRMSVLKAFLIGWGLAAFGVIHLWVKVNQTAAIFAALTIATYVFIYTPMKKMTSLNTLVGAIPGALPPLIGWVAAGQSWTAPGAWFLFALLFLWQLPHFVAISWLCREEYEGAGYAMWSNGDASGKKSAWLAGFFSVLLGLLALAVIPLGLTRPGSWLFAGTGLLFGLWKAVTAYDFGKTGERKKMRKLFFLTLIYLPLALVVLAIDWR